MPAVPPAFLDLRSLWRGLRATGVLPGFALFVGFSDDCRLVVRFGVVVFVLGIIVIIVGVSRRHRVAAGNEPVYCLHQLLRGVKNIVCHARLLRSAQV